MQTKVGKNGPPKLVGKKNGPLKKFSTRSPHRFSTCSPHRTSRAAEGWSARYSLSCIGARSLSMALHRLSAWLWGWRLKFPSLRLEQNWSDQASNPEAILTNTRSWKGSAIRESCSPCSVHRSQKPLVQQHGRWKCHIQIGRQLHPRILAKAKLSETFWKHVSNNV
jgi:hypothetical protein